MADLDSLREEIDRIDAELIGLFQRRMTVARQIAVLKKTRNLPIYDAAREKALLADRTGRIAEPAFRAGARLWFRKLLAVSRAVQMAAQKGDTAGNGLSPSDMPGIALIGMPFSGKTTVGRLLAFLLGAGMADTDEMIERNSGKTIPEIFALEGEEEFRNRETEIIRCCSTLKGCVLATGGGAVLRGKNMALLREAGYIIVFVHRSLRLSALDLDAGSRPLTRDVNALQALYRERIGLYRGQADLEVSNDDSPLDTAEKIILALADRL